MQKAGPPKPMTYEEDLLFLDLFSRRVDENGMYILIFSDGDVDGRVRQVKVVEDRFLKVLNNLLV